jgi:DNA-binding XRE family transcriptional regulator
MTTETPKYREPLSPMERIEAVRELVTEGQVHVHVGKTLRRYRKAAHLTQGDVAKRMRISQGFWSKIERGESTLSIGNLFRFGAILEIPPSTIISEAEWTGAFLEGRSNGSE